MAVIGLVLQKTYEARDPLYEEDIVVEFWRPIEFHINVARTSGWLKWAPYKNQAHFLSNGGASYYKPGVLTFAITPQNWPFVPGTDPMTKFWAFVKTHTAIQNEDGGEINGGLDWSTAVDSTYP